MFKPTKIRVLGQNLCEYFNIPFRLIDDVIVADKQGLENILISEWGKGVFPRNENHVHTNKYLIITRTTFPEGIKCETKLIADLLDNMTSDDWVTLEKFCKRQLA